MVGQSQFISEMEKVMSSQANTLINNDKKQRWGRSSEKLKMRLMDFNSMPNRSMRIRIMTE